MVIISRAGTLYKNDPPSRLAVYTKLAEIFKMPYVLRNREHGEKVWNSPVGQELFEESPRRKILSRFDAGRESVRHEADLVVHHQFLQALAALEIDHARPRDAVDPGQAGRDLGVRFLLTGTVRKDSKTVKITIRLLDTATAEQIWMESYILTSQR